MTEQKPYTIEYKPFPAKERSPHPHKFRDAVYEFADSGCDSAEVGFEGISAEKAYISLYYVIRRGRGKGRFWDISVHRRGDSVWLVRSEPKEQS